MTPPPARVGQPATEIDTPALVIELNAYERNLDRMARGVAAYPGVRLRAHAKTHKCAVIARHQIARGAVGVCCQKVGEAEALVDGGVDDVLVSNEVVGRAKIERLVALAKRAAVGVCADDAGNLRGLNSAAGAVGVQLPVLVEVDVGAGRCGVAPGPAAVALARAIAESPNLRFAGVQAYQGKAQHLYDADQRRAAVDEVNRQTAAVVQLLREAGLPCAVVTGAGTGTWQFEAGGGVFTEVQAGSYVFMDADYGRVDGFPREFEQSLFVVTTVMSRPTPGRAVLDAGLKSLAVDSGPPLVHGRPGVDVVAVNDEHTILSVADPASGPRLGEQIWLVPGHCDPTVNLFDWYACVRNERVEALWPIVARGAVQ
jgi:D-serine deaminase-like pyridoxal phosphate-dependent protein